MKMPIHPQTVGTILVDYAYALMCKLLVYLMLYCNSTCLFDAVLSKLLCLSNDVLCKLLCVCILCYNA